VQRGGAGAAVVPPLAEVGLVRVQDAGPASGLDQQFLEAVGAGELPGGVAAQSQAAGDLEGKNCKIKYLKRLMYERANFDLLLLD
jgi:hypothetical protein